MQITSFLIEYFYTLKDFLWQVRNVPVSHQVKKISFIKSESFFIRHVLH